MNSLENLRIESEKFYVSPATREFAEDIFNALDDDITRYEEFNTPQHIDETIKFLEKNEEKAKKQEGTSFVVYDKDNNFIGMCGIHKLYTNEPEIGLRISKSWQGKGISKEIMSLLIKRVFENCDVDCLQAMVDKRNIPALRLVEKFGGVFCDGPYEKQKKDNYGNFLCFLYFLKYKIYNSATQ